MNSAVNRRDFLRAMGIGAAAFVVPGCIKNMKPLTNSPEPVDERPNFVIILTDDQGYADVGVYGAKGFKTPNLDRMAAEGTLFTDFYAGASVCTPSRAALLTGCYATRVGLPETMTPSKGVWQPYKSNMGISSNEETIAELLKRRGYATACIGKWHLGHLKRFLPTSHGFDEFFGLPYSNDMWPKNKSKYPPLPLIEGEDAIEYNPDQTQLTTRYTERAVKFIKKNRDKPFFIYLAHSMPHVPLHVSDKFKGKSERGLYGDVIMEIDWSVGQVLSTLKQQGIAEKTIVVFYSDNGPWIMFGEHAGFATPFREGKKTTFEGGVRVPAICWCPGRIPAGVVNREMVAGMDLLPTFVKLAGAARPKLRIDGKDIWPLMSGETGSRSPHKAFFFYQGWNLEAVRSGKWKMHLPHPYNIEMRGKGGKAGGYTKAKIGLSLFDLENDNGERHNVASEYPQVVKRLLKLVDKMREDLGDSMVGMMGKNRRSPGMMENLL